MILLRTLGQLGTDTAAGRLSSRRKELSLLAFLARSPRPVPRAELAALLWEGAEDAKARQSLRQALLELRRVVGDGLTAEGELVRLEPTAVRVDATAFEMAIAEGRPADALEWWGGDFLTGMEDVGGEVFRTWLEVERERLRRALAGALERLTTGSMERGDWDAATAWAERWTGALPLDEQGHQRLIEALWMAGRPAEARSRYAAAVARLRTELDAEPGPALRGAGAQVERPASHAPSTPQPGSAALFTPDLVGRRPALTELEAAWRSSLAGTCTVVVIEGETGIGKTRAAEEFLRGAGGEGGGVIASVPTGARVPAGGAARVLLEQLADAPGLAAASPAALARAIALAPRIGARFPSLCGSEDSLAVEDTVAEVLTAVAGDRPVVLWVDDLELADDDTLFLLVTAARRARGRVLLIAAIGTDQRRAPDALATLMGAPGVRRLKLPPLSRGEVEALIASMLVLPSSDRHSLAARLHSEGGGNPLYTIELAAALVDEGVLAVGDQGSWRLVMSEGWSVPLPSGIREIIGTRLARLGEEARTVVEAMATLQPHASEAAAREIAALPADRFDIGRDELIARRLIRLSPDHPSAFQFSHEMVRRVVVERAAAAARPGPGAGAPPGQQGRPRYRMPLTAAAIVVGAASAFAAFRYLAARPPAAAPAAPQVVVAQPDLAPGATAAESLASLMLRLAIDHAVPYRRLPEPALRAALGRMRRDTSRTPNEATAREIAIRTGTGLVLVPAVTRIADGVTVSYRLSEAESGRTLRLREAESADSNELRRATGRLVEQLDGDIADAVGRIPGRLPLPEVTTASLEALRAFHAGVQLLQKSDPDWVAMMHSAIEQDSSFAVPYGLLAYEYWFTYDQRRAAIYADAAERLARGLPTAERLRVLLDVANAREDWSAAILNARALLALDADNASTWLALAQLYYFDRQYSRAVEMYDSAGARTAPARPPTLLMNRAAALARVGREREAVALFEEGFAAQSTTVLHQFVNHEYGVALVRLGRIDDARAAYRRRLDGLPAGRAGGLRSLAMLEAHLGHFALANQLLTDADAASSASGDTLGTAIARLLRAEVQTVRGRTAEALADLEMFERLAALHPLPYELLGRGVKLLARLGARSRAEAMLRRVYAQTRAVSRAARGRLLLASGELLLAKGRTAEGRTAIEQALALEPTEDALESAGFAAVAAGAPQAAAERYDSLATRHALDWDGHAVLELGRYLAARAWDNAGQPGRAMAGYEAFLEAWPDPDADLPPVADARRRRAALAR